MRRACRHEKCLARLHAPMHKNFLQSFRFDGFQKLRSIHLRHWSDQHIRAGLGGDNMPHFRLRSEEHTSELQSRFDLVCRLLLEKKKKKNTTHSPHNIPSDNTTKISPI